MEIRLVDIVDAAGFAEYFSDNVEHFRPWQPIREAGYYSRESLTKRLADYEQQHAEGSAAHFVGLISGQVISHCSLTNIVYGPFRACFMGYGVSKNLEGTGTMSKVCQAAIEYAFGELELNRVMANYMPCNERSAHLLKRLGFSEEGVAKKYLKINGRWEDHVLTSLINPANS